MDRPELRKLLKQIESGRLSANDALDRIRLEQVEKLEQITLDLGRAVRRGFPEVVYGMGKTSDQIVAVIEKLRDAGQVALITRVAPEIAGEVTTVLEGVEHHPLARALVARPRGKRRVKPRPGIVLLSAGTSDLPVAAEAKLTAELMGNEVTELRDVGVAGLHRLLAEGKTLIKARVLVVVAGMEGALPSVVTGLTDCPVIGVPTSVGYGTGGGGEVALLSMLNSCAAGLTVVNVDNGFGAGYAASLINRQGRPGR